VINIVDRLRLDAEPTESDMEEAAAEIERLRAENNHLRRVGMDRPSAELHEAALAELRAENERLRAGLQKIVDADGWWDAPSLARDLLAGKDVT
jgi:cell division protein FtsB